MIKKIALLFIIASSLSSCNDIYYDAETRLIIEGKLVDKNGAPIQNQYIDITVNQNDAYGDEDQDVISYGASGADGSFRFAIPGPRNPDNTVNVRINNLSNNGYYQWKDFVNIKRKDFVDYTFRLNDVALYALEDISSLRVQPERTNAMHTLKDVSLEGIKAQSIVAVNPLPAEAIFDEYLYEVIKNQIVTLNYTVVDATDPGNPTTTQYSIPIEINSDPFTLYTLSY